MKTCVAIFNIGNKKRGYVLVGIVDSDYTAWIEGLFDVRCITNDRVRISGTEHESLALGKTLKQLFQMIVDKIARSKMSEPLCSYITSNIKSVRYFDETVYVLENVGQEQPSLYDNSYYECSGAQLKENRPADFRSFSVNTTREEYQQPRDMDAALKRRTRKIIIH
jgi:hypothetical protein